MRHHKWSFDIDRIFNPIIPPPPWKHIPYPVARWFGYRKTKPEATGNLMPIFWAFVGVFSAITIIEAVSQHVPSFKEHGAPIIVGSFGAAAVLEFYAIEAPLAQPRNAIGGQLVSAIVGVAVAKLFLLSDRFDEIYWYGGALACASATALMALTKTVHPPAGATALLAVVDSRLVAIGWWLVPVMLLGCALMLGVALVINNIERRFPVYWWTPEDPQTTKPMFTRRKSEDAEKGQQDATTTEAPAAAAAETPAEKGEHKEVGHTNGHTSGNTNGNTNGVLGGDTNGFNVKKTHRHAGEVVIRPGEVTVPEHMYLTPEEKLFLETLSNRL